MRGRYRDEARPAYVELDYAGDFQAAALSPRSPGRSDRLGSDGGPSFIMRKSAAVGGKPSFVPRPAIDWPRCAIKQIAARACPFAAENPR